MRVKRCVDCPALFGKILNKPLAGGKVVPFMRKVLGNLSDFLDTKKGAALALVCLYVLGVLFTIYVIDANVYGAMHFNDEVRYWDIARAIFEGNFSFATDSDYPPFYSISLLPAFYLFSPFTRYAAARWLNALYLTSTVFPAYLLLRKFLDRKTSLLAVFVLLCGPIQLVIARTLISENVFYPVFMWAVLLAFSSLTPLHSKARIMENILFGILLALLYATRFIGLALIPAFLLVWWLKPFGKEKLPLLFSWKKFAHILIIVGSMLLLLAIWQGAGLRAGVSLKTMLGFSVADHPDPAQLGKRRLLMWAIFYLCYTLEIAAPYLGLMLASLSQFKLKDWQSDENRWWISLTLIVFFFLLACVRHSWRAAYNYPDPVKLQGRYIMYFGPLFLITAFSFFGKQLKVKNKVLFGLTLIFLTAALILFAYATLDGTFIYPMDQPLAASVNSPYGSLVLTMKVWYVILALAIMLASILLLGEKKAFQVGLLVLFLLSFNIYGSILIYQRQLTPRQLLNTQIHYLMENFNSCNVEDQRTAKVTLEIPADTTSRVIRSWHQALNFNGYTNNELIPSAEISADPRMLFRAAYGDCMIDIQHVDEGEYAAIDGIKFDLSGYYYQIFVQHVD
jgi:hypothetical protein